MPINGAPTVTAAPIAPYHRVKPISLALVVTDEIRPPRVVDSYLCFILKAPNKLVKIKIALYLVKTLYNTY
jgi:hypothetical protein